MAVHLFIHLLFLFLISQLFIATVEAQGKFHKAVSCMTKVKHSSVTPNSCKRGKESESQ